MGKPNRKPLDKETGEKVLKLFKGVPEWTPKEASLDIISLLGLVRPHDTISIWISGSCSNPQLSNGIDNIIVGIDVLTHETKPNLAKNESPGNAYHYILQRITDERFPYILYGPFDEGTIISHWFDDDDLDVYFLHDRKEI